MFVAENQRQTTVVECSEPLLTHVLRKRLAGVLLRNAKPGSIRAIWYMVVHRVLLESPTKGWRTFYDFQQETNKTRKQKNTERV